MNDENSKYLTEKYESIIHRHEYKGNIMPFWFECGDGWFTIIDELCSDIQHYVEQNKRSLDFKKERGELVEDIEYEQAEVKVVQVKEKFGGLRFYINGGDDYVNGMINFAESMAYKTCERCGLPGKLNNKGWSRVLCAACNAADEDARMAERQEAYKKAAEKVDAQNGG